MSKLLHPSNEELVMARILRRSSIGMIERMGKEEAATTGSGQWLKTASVADIVFVIHLFQVGLGVLVAMVTIK